MYINILYIFFVVRYFNNLFLNLNLFLFISYNLVDEEDLKGMKWVERKRESDTKEISAKKSA